MALLQLSLEDPPEYLPLIRLFCVEACGLSGAYVRKPLSLTAWQTHFATGKHHDCVRDHYTNWFQDRSSVHSLLAEEEGYYDMAMDSPPSTISQCPEEYYPNDDDYLDEEVLETGSVMWHPPGTTLISLPEYRTTAGPSNATQPPPSVPVVLPPLPPPLPTPGVEIKGNSFFSPTGGLFRCLKILQLSQSHFLPPGLNTPLQKTSTADSNFPFRSATFALLFFWRFLLAPTLVSSSTRVTSVASLE